MLVNPSDFIEVSTTPTTHGTQSHAGGWGSDDFPLNKLGDFLGSKCHALLGPYFLGGGGIGGVPLDSHENVHFQGCISDFLLPPPLQPVFF